MDMMIMGETWMCNHLDRFIVGVPGWIRGRRPDSNTNAILHIDEPWHLPGSLPSFSYTPNTPPKYLPSHRSLPFCCTLRWLIDHLVQLCRADNPIPHAEIRSGEYDRLLDDVHVQVVE